MSIGHFYFAQIGHYHFAATLDGFVLDGFDPKPYDSLAAINHLPALNRSSSEPT
jgi:hypothetical protein